MGLLKPRGRFRRLPPGLHQVIDLLAESGIGQHALDLVPRDRLQDNPGVMSEFPQFGIKLPPHFVGRMIPRPAHIQGKLGQGIEPLDFRGQKAVNRVADTCLFDSSVSSRRPLRKVSISLSNGLLNFSTPSSSSCCVTLSMLMPSSGSRSNTQRARSTSCPSGLSALRGRGKRQGFRAGPC